MSTWQGNMGLVGPKVRTGADTTGPWREETYYGSKDAVLGGVAALTGASSYSTDHEGDKWSFTVRYATSTPPGGGDPEVPVREEKLHWNRIQTAIFQDIRWSGITNYEMQAIRGAVEQRKEFKDITTLTFKNAAGTATTISPDGILLAGLAIAGVESALVFQPVVIITETASAGYAWNPNFDSYGAIWTTALLFSRLTSGWKANLPASSNPSAKPGFAYGWLKGPPEITTTGFSRSQLVQEWEFGLWSTELYTTLS